MSKRPTRGLDKERLRIAMAAAGIEGPAALCRAVGLPINSTGTITRWIQGVHMPSGENLLRLAAVLRVSIPYIQGFTPQGDRAQLAAGLREFLGHELKCPEADIVLAMGELTFGQRQVLADMVIGVIPSVKGVTAISEPSPPPSVPTQRRRRHTS